MISLLIALFGLPFAFLFLWKIPQLRRGIPKESKSFSIVIPARNEEKNLPILLGQILENSLLPIEIIVVDDQSTDRTADIAYEFGCTVIHVDTKPQDWNGKSYALWLGAQKSSGELLLFLDADVKLSCHAFESLLAEFEQQSGNFLALQPFHSIAKPYENLASFMNLLVLGGVGSFGFLDKSNRAIGSFGPVQLMYRGAYFLAGGHEKIKNESVEDLAMVELFKSIGMETHLLSGSKLIHFRMYPGGLKDLFWGFSKSMSKGAGHTPGHKLIFSILWISGALSTLGSFAYAPIFASVLYLLYAAQFAYLQSKAGNFHFFNALFYPIALIFFLIVQCHSIYYHKVRKQNVWKGRTLEVGT